ncbi:hypothetical protein NE237_009425 [Protea cynaroides]|uniref:Uncharacterized protein n=1 Tax=Protea cynaroides TaxID=273540 RepID=A0A9Q0R0Q9_9MAGN|nr:hypothetical protein NE237_009425 [Protea cynaroides]
MGAGAIGGGHGYERGAGLVENPNLGLERGLGVALLPRVSSGFSVVSARAGIWSGEAGRRSFIDKGTAADWREFHRQGRSDVVNGALQEEALGQTSVMGQEITEIPSLVMLGSSSSRISLSQRYLSSFCKSSVITH